MMPLTHVLLKECVMPWKRPLAIKLGSVMPTLFGKA